MVIGSTRPARRAGRRDAARTITPNRTATAANVGTSNGRTPNSRLSKRARDQQRHADAQRNAHRSEADALPEHHGEQLSGSRAQRGAYAKLRQTVRDRVRQDAVNADHAQAERERGEQPEQQQRESLRRDGIGGNLRERLHLEHGEIGIDRAHHPPDHRQQRVWIPVRPHG